MNADAAVKLLFGLLLSVLGWMGIDAMKRLRHLETDTVRKSDLRALMAQLRDEHKENREDMGEVKKSISAVHRRIDRAFGGGQGTEDYEP